MFFFLWVYCIQFAISKYGWFFFLLFEKIELNRERDYSSYVWSTKTLFNIEKKNVWHHIMLNNWYPRKNSLTCHNLIYGLRRLPLCCCFCCYHCYYNYCYCWGGEGLVVLVFKTILRKIVLVILVCFKEVLALLGVLYLYSLTSPWNEFLSLKVSHLKITQFLIKYFI